MNNKKIIKTCPICGAKFEANSNRAKYCSNECRKEARKEINKRYYESHKVLKDFGFAVDPITGETFHKKTYNHKYISAQTRATAYRRERAKGFKVSHNANYNPHFNQNDVDHKGRIVVGNAKGINDELSSLRRKSSKMGIDWAI